jgi:molybdate transport system ATP-binding protein
MIKVDLHKKLETPEGSMLLDISFEMQKGDFVTLYGPSGAGKTSSLRMLSGLMKPDAGLIDWEGEKWYDSEKNVFLKAQKRQVGFVFQDYALFPNLTVKENLVFALQKGQEKGMVENLIDTMELGELQYRKPDTLSGGQQQRVALARAIVQRPKLLLLDEPLSALDTKMRIRLQDYLKELHKKYELSIILVSHDVSEILKLSNKVLVLENGSIQKSGSPKQVFTVNQVHSKFQFTGEVLEIQKEEVVFVVTLLIGTNIVKIIAQASEIKDLNPGDKVLVASKAFNPVLQKIQS